MSTVYTPKVSYTYQVKGNSYTGNAIRASPMAGGGVFGARKILVKFPVGANVPAWYDPTVPADAVLIQGPSWTDYLVAFIGLLFSGIGIAIAMGLIATA
jgi:hypothetical protein